MPGPRTPLSRQRVIAAAVALADEIGIGALTMRRLGDAVGVEAMSLYNHVANKEDLLDGMVDAVFAEFHRPQIGAPWREEMEQRCRTARTALDRHRWAAGLLDSRRTPGPETLAHHDAVLGTLRVAGFSLEEAGHAFSLLDSYVYGFALQAAALPFDSPDSLAEVADEILAALPADEYPHFVEFTRDRALQPGYDFGDEFEVGLQVVLDGLERSYAAG